jgi:hypothetical protein
MLLKHAVITEKGHLESVQRDPVVDGPAGEQVQVADHVSGRDHREAVRVRRPGHRVRWCRASGQPVPDARPGQVPVAQRRGRPFGDDPPGGDHGHPVRQVLRLVHVVRGQQHCLAERCEVLDYLPRVAPGRRVESRGRLVEEQQVGVACQRDRHVQPAGLSAGQLGDPAVPLLGQAGEVDDLVR